MANTPNYDINYEDERLSAVKKAETDQLTEDEQTYQKVMDNASTMYDELKDATEEWKNTQTDIQNKQTDFTIQQIEQQKEQAQKDYTKEQAGAYVDWQKQSNQYGANAEKMASAGLTNTGFSESSQVSMYNTYQNRVAVARESFQQAWTNYNNKITEAKLQNNAAIAQIALEAFQKQAEYSLQSAQYQNQLILDLADKKMQTKQFYATQWQNVLDQMNKEIDRQWQADQNELSREHDKEMAKIENDYALQRAEVEQGYKKELAEIEQQYALDLVEANTKAEKELADHNYELAIKKLEEEQKDALERLDKELANEKALAKYQNELKSGTISGGSGGSGSSGGGSSKSSSIPAKSTLPILANGGTTTKTGSSNTGKTTQATLNSITALGYGPISAAKLDQLVASGAVIEYVSNGVTLFRKANAQLKTSALYQQLQKPASVSLPTSKLRK